MPNSSSNINEKFSKALTLIYMKIKAIELFSHFIHTSIYTYAALIHKTHSAEAAKDADKA